MWKKYRGFRSVLVLFALLTFITGCEKELTEAEESKIAKKLTAQDLELIQANNNLSLNILKSEIELNKEENFFFSPVSVGMALGMIYNGVGEREKIQIQQITGLETLVEKEINKSYNEFLSFMELNYKRSDIFCANSMWFSYDLDINENYRTKIMAYYDAEISEINFGKKTSLQYINNWGSLKSLGQLENLTNYTPSNNYDIYFVNAFGINTSWENGRYFLTKNDFTNLKGEKTEIQSINLDQVTLNTSDNEYFQYVEIPLKGDEFLFSILNPSEGVSLENLVENFTFNELVNQIGTTVGLTANVSLPEISFSSENTLKSTLGNLGLKNIFQPSLDLSPSFITKNKGISEINQVARFNIKGQKEIGEALSFTNQSLSLLNINKPFLYFVRDRQTKSVIFAGYYLNPQE